jgi:beta-N-acetylhexosaminidase
VRRARRDLEEMELVPFRAAIRAGVPMLMTAHVLYPALDESKPATFSAPILRDLLRREMGFEGVVISDDLEMGAVSRHMQVEDAAVAALLAGIDWVLICNDLDLAVRAAERIADAIEDGRLDRHALAASARRIRGLAVPRRHGAASEPPLAAHRQLAERIRQRALSTRAV